MIAEQKKWVIILTHRRFPALTSKGDVKYDPTEVVVLEVDMNLTLNEYMQKVTQEYKNIISIQLKPLEIL